MRNVELFLSEGLGFLEGPRWREDRLFFSDMLLERVWSTDPGGNVRTEAQLADRASGLGWLPDGRLLIVSMQQRKLIRREQDGSLVVHADLSEVAPADLNDMVVAADGTAYVGNWGSEVVGGDPPRAAKLAVVHPDGSVSAGPDGLMFANGSVITADGKTLIVGETFASRFTAFPIGPNGRLGTGRLWAEATAGSPDGCTLDAAGAIWYASPAAGIVARILEGGEITETVHIPDQPFACALGGNAGRTLFVLSSPQIPTPDQFRRGLRGSAPDDMCPGTARVWSIEVDVPHAGRP